MSKKKQSSSNLGKSKFFSRMFAEALEVPEELALDMPKITLIGNQILDIENHKGIISYSQKQVKLKVSSGFLAAAGQNLSLKNISQEEVKLVGDIRQIAIILDSNTKDSFDDIYNWDDIDEELEQEDNTGENHQE